MRYDAHAFSDDLPNGRSSGVVTFESRSLYFRGGGKEFVLPLAGITLRLGGASDRLVFFEHTRVAGVSIHTADRSILKDASLTTIPELEPQLVAATKQGRKKWFAFALAAALVLAIPAAFVASFGFLTELAASNIPLEWEHKLGEAALGEYQTNTELTQLAPMDQLASVLTDKIDDQHGYQFEFHVSNDDAINAFAAPGGIVVVHSGLILEAESAAELLGVLAHEVSHVTAQHGTRSVINSLGWLIVLQAALGDASGLFGVLVQSAPFLISQQYSQSFENEADALGVSLLSQARVDPQGLIAFFETLIEQRDELPELAELEASLAFLSSHPATEERIARINALIDRQHADYRELDTEFLTLQDAVREWQDRLDEDN